MDRWVDQVDRVMETAAGLQAPLLCLDLGPLPAPAAVARERPAVRPDEAGLIFLPTPTAAPEPAPAPPPPPDPAFVSQVDAALSEVGRRADRYGVTVALRSDRAGFAALARALAAAACPWFGVDLDPTALLRDEWPAEEVFSRFGDLIRHVRGRDALSGADRRTQPAPVGRGSTDWPAFLAHLDAAGYGGWLTIDPIELTDRRGAAGAGVEYLRKL